MKELFFKITIAESLDNPLTLEETRQFPTFEIHLAQYHEKLINVMYKPADGFDKDKFIQLIRVKLMRKYKAALVEYLERKSNLIQE